MQKAIEQMFEIVILKFLAHILHLKFGQPLEQQQWSYLVNIIIKIVD